ncbi:NOT2/NOT3/NOT5 [Ostreococcus tauri]|uniref:NOT2/NOT3/NOT5 n=1 Tax=Ostreococcus tauri TaxID=70448 RepID=A0A090N3J1_OSTTA|nr:NOT2/NOT3/NOT5 [Ostreococcus tauri]CEF98208.1 NOT2/NOT3/NOT5 [Ostreococcus tauri]|eukprot:XP_003079650.2 NOT2/NOT3/NOT5 [Ostreococcus tauri]
MQSNGYGAQGNAPPPGPYGQQGGLPGMNYGGVPRPGGQFAQQRPMANPPGMQGAPAMPRAVMGGAARQGSLPLPYGGVPGQPPGMMSNANAGAQGTMAQGGMSSGMGAAQRGVMLDRSQSQPVGLGQGGVPANLQRASSGLPMPSAGVGMTAPRTVGMMSSGPVPRAYPTIGSQGDMNSLPKMQGAGGLELGSSAGMGGGLGGFNQDQKAPGFDDSEFPTLGGGGGGGMPQRVASFGNGYGMPGEGHESVYDFGKPQRDFSMEKEDFPALGGKGPGNMGGLVPPQSLDSKDGAGVSYPPLARQSSGGVGFGTQAPGRQGGAPGGFQFEGGAPPPPVKSSASPTGPSGTLQKDRYGLLGLLPVIRMVNPNVSTLALGADLTMLGLNLNSPDSLCKSFTLPWNDSAPNNDLELTIPSAYSQQVCRCHPAVFAKFQQETLFYIFYSMPGEESQLFAADELVQRGWGFHKELKAWLMRVANTEAANQTEQGERGSFWVFDPIAWDRVRKDNFTLQYDQLETRPTVPARVETGLR